MIARLTGLLAATAVIAILAVGCGGGGNSDSTGPTGGGAEAQSGEKTGTSEEAQSTEAANDGGSSQESTEANPSGGAKAIKTSSLSKDQFIKQASALCDREIDNILAETEAYLTKKSAEGVPRPELFADAAKVVLMPVVETRIAGIRKLGAPAGDEGEVDEMLASQEEGIAEVMKLETFVEGESLVPYFAESNKKFDAYGLEACAYNL